MFFFVVPLLSLCCNWN